MLPLAQSVIEDDPVFIDLETRSAADLRRVGGWNYATDETTHLLTVAWSPVEGEYHIWYPWHTAIREDYSRAQGISAIQHVGKEVPDALLEVTNRRWCAHNAWNFDSLVWERLAPVDAQPTDWIDSEPLARATGLPGGLDAIGKRLWGEGKYKAAKPVLKKHMKGVRFGDAADVPVGVMPMLAEYNVQDVVLLRGVWQEIKKWLRMPQNEWDVLTAHRAVNDRGAEIDHPLLLQLIDLTEEGRVQAVKRIAELTKDCKVKLQTINDLQSRSTMFRWLDSIGITEFGTYERGSLRKELISRFIDVYTSGTDDDDPLDDADSGVSSREILEGNIEGASVVGTERRRLSAAIGLAVQVLQLRGAALRITGGKLAAAASAVCADGRVRGLFVYAGAHTFRWAGRRIQVQNLPRPKDGLTVERLDSGGYRYPIWEMIASHEGGGKLDYASVETLLPSRDKYPLLTSDDAASAMIRGLFVGTTELAAGEDRADWRTEHDPIGLLAADLSNIENRVLAKLAGEKWLMAAFWDGADPYIPMAEKIFGKRETWPNYDPKTVKKHSYRQVGKIVELGSGYSLGGSQMDIYAVANGIDLAANSTTGPECVLAYRRSHPAIAGYEAGEYDGRPYFKNGFWSRLNDAALNACYFPGKRFRVKADGGWPVDFIAEGPHLMVYLPSGRRLVYREARVEAHTPKFLVGTGETIDAVIYTNPRYGRQAMYGGKWAENVVQAVSRDFLAAAIVRLERIALPVPLHVHDEAVSIGRLSDKSRFMTAFTVLPDWAVDFPLDAEGGWLPRYSKSPPPGDRYKEEVWRNGRYLKFA